MIDYGLLISIIIGFGIPSLLAMSTWRLSSFGESVGFLDVAIGPAFAGLAAGRLTALALDDPTSIGSISDMIIIRSGVEFWPGVAAASSLAAWTAWRSSVRPLVRLADLAPLSIVGYAGYEAACIFRDGCFGPESAVGLRPPGLSATMLPIGLFMAVALVAAAVGVRHIAKSGGPPLVVVLTSLCLVAGVRSIGSIWLPHVGDGLTRQHVTSMVVFATSGTALLVLAVATKKRRSISHSRA